MHIVYVLVSVQLYICMAALAGDGYAAIITCVNNFSVRNGQKCLRVYKLGGGVENEQDVYQI